MERQKLITAQVLACMLLSLTLGVAVAFLISVWLAAAGEPYRDMRSFLDTVLISVALLSGMFGVVVMLPFGLALCVQHLTQPSSSETRPSSSVTYGLLWFTMWIGMPCVVLGAHLACWSLFPATTDPNFGWTFQSPGVSEYTQAWLLISGVAVTAGLIAFVLAVAIRGWVRRIDRESGLCSKCGYSLHGLTGSICPECGTASA